MPYFSYIAYRRLLFYCRFIRQSTLLPMLLTALLLARRTPSCSMKDINIIYNHPTIGAYSAAVWIKVFPSLWTNNNFIRMAVGPCVLQTEGAVCDDIVEAKAHKAHIVPIVIGIRQIPLTYVPHLGSLYSPSPIISTFLQRHYNQSKQLRLNHYLPMHI